MKPPPAFSELLATLDLYANGGDPYCLISQEAARVLRLLAMDFIIYGWHTEQCAISSDHPLEPCDCGFDELRKRLEL